MPRWRRRVRARRLATGLINVAIVLVALFPILWGVSTSLKAPDAVLRFPPEIIPSEPTLENYALLFRTGIERYIWNSTLVSAAAVFGTLLLGSWPPTRWRGSPSRQGIPMFSVVALMSIPLPSLLVPTHLPGQSRRSTAAPACRCSTSPTSCRSWWILWPLPVAADRTGACRASTAIPGLPRCARW